MIREVKLEDASQICSIYNHYVEHTTITFEESPISVTQMKERISDTTASLPWIVYEEAGEVLGYAYASKWKGRCAYRFSVESTVYLKNTSTGRGFGTQLYSALLEKIKELKMHVVIGGIALPNDKSQRLHERLGFTKVAHFSQVGYKFDRWIDVGYWELRLSEG